MKTPIILLQECHLHAVSVLERLCFSSPWNESQFKDAMHSAHFHLYGYFDDDLLLAYLLVSQVDDYFEIINIATHPENRRKGYAYNLLDYFFKQHDETKIETIINTQTILEVRSKNIAAQELYKKFGFVQIHVRKNYYDDNGDDALVMEHK